MGLVGTKVVNNRTEFSMEVDANTVDTVSKYNNGILEFYIASMYKGTKVPVKERDLVEQLVKMFWLRPKQQEVEMLKVHFDSYGEPTWNEGIIGVCTTLRELGMRYLGCTDIYPVLTTQCPADNDFFMEFLINWCNSVKNSLYEGSSGLEFILGSTEEKVRKGLFDFDVYSISDVARVVDSLPQPKGTKYTLTFFADSICYSDIVSILFDPNKCNIKLLTKEGAMQDVDRLKREFSDDGFKVIVESIQ